VVTIYLIRIASPYRDWTPRGKGLANRQKISPGPGLPPQDAELVEIEKSTESWNEYTLADGTIIRLKQVLLEAWRMLDLYDQEGNPQYVLKSAGIPHIRAPAELKKKVQ
jgi:hypothetical protein